LIAAVAVLFLSAYVLFGWIWLRDLPYSKFHQPISSKELFALSQQRIDRAGEVVVLNF
jgi:hypothetical protein